MITYLNSVLNTNQRYISISRPRRFGKTMAVDMVCAYYDRTTSSREIFENTKLSQNESCDDKSWDKYLQKFDVIRLVMTDFIRKDSTVSDSMNLIRKRIIAELKELYPNVSYDEEDLFYSLEKCYLKTNTQFVVVIDEWDVVFRIRKEDKEGQNFYLNFLRDLLKDKNYIALAYMTGILPIKK